jgi:hypothetical protein
MSDGGAQRPARKPGGSKASGTLSKSPTCARRNRSVSKRTGSTMRRTIRNPIAEAPKLASTVATSNLRRSVRRSSTSGLSTSAT